MFEEFFFIFLIIAFILVFLLCIYVKLRPRYSVKVNCWFCNKNTVVPYGNINCWDCPFCDQYNGFTKDGGYNKPIPAQHIEDLNHPINAVIADKNYEFKNRLCESCSRNQCLKIKQLAKFQPHFESTFDDEVAKFSDHLNKVYKLCDECENNLQNKLSEEVQSLQANILDHQLNESFDQQTVLNRSISESKLQSGTSLVLRCLTIIACIFLFVCNVHLLQEDCGTTFVPFKSFSPFLFKFLKLFSSDASAFLPIFGLFATIFAVFNSGKYRLQKTDGLTCVIWVLVLIIHNQQIYLAISKQDVLVLRPLLSIIVFGFTIVSTACRRYTFMRSIRGKLIPKQTRPSPAGKVRSMNSSYESCQWDDAFSSVSQQTCRRCSSQIGSVTPISLINKTPSTPLSTVDPTIVKTSNLPSDFLNMKISGVMRSKEKSKSVVQPSKLDLINQLESSKPYSRSSWVDGGFWDDQFAKTSHINQMSSIFSGQKMFGRKFEPLASAMLQYTIAVLAA